MRYLRGFSAPVTLQVLLLVDLVGTISSYGLDCSFPIHNTTLNCGTEVLGDRTSIYGQYMEGCRKTYSTERCDEGENERIRMNIRQPQSMVNFTSTGFRKMRAPQRLQEMLTNFWKINNKYMELENWSKGNIYTNHWHSPTFMVGIENDKFEGGGEDLMEAVWDAARDGIEEWTSMKLRPSSVYGVRVYTEGAILNPHVDRIPLISSAIVNVAQDVEEDWPLEVYDRSGNAVNITMEPGDMVLYESGSVVHGRPFPLKGTYYANIFIHFEPIEQLNEEEDSNGHLTLPPYVLPGSPEAEHWKEDNPTGWSKHLSEMDKGYTNMYAAHGNLDMLKEMVEADINVLKYEDENGWQPIHEAVRHGQLEIVMYLMEQGIDMNVRTYDGEGLSPMNIAKTFLGLEDPVYQLLESLGAEDVAYMDGTGSDEEDEDDEEWAEEVEEVWNDWEDDEDYFEGEEEDDDEYWDDEYWDEDEEWDGEMEEGEEHIL